MMIQSEPLNHRQVGYTIANQELAMMDILTEYPLPSHAVVSIYSQVFQSGEYLKVVTQGILRK